MKIRPLLAAALTSALLLAACGGGSGNTPSNEEPGGKVDQSSGEDAGPERAKVTYVAAATVPGSTNIGVIAVARHLGFFEDENIEIGEEFADGSTAAMQVMTAGAGDVSAGGVVSIMGAVNEGVPIKGFANIIQNYHWRIGTLSDSGVTSAEDLRGKSIGIISLASESNFFTRAWLQENGLDPDTDVDLVPVGAGAPALQALRDGEIAAYGTYTEIFQTLSLQGAEFTILDNPPLFDVMPSISLTATTDTLENDADVLARFGRAVFKGLLFAWLNPEAAVRISYEAYPERLPESGNPEDGVEDHTKIFTEWINAVMPLSGDPLEWGPMGSIDQQAFDNAREFGLSAGQLAAEVDFDEVWTNDLIAEINDFDRQEIIDLAEAWTPEDL